MAKRLNNYISDTKILWMVEDQEMTYPEIVEYMRESIGVEFNKETIGRHYRDFKEELEEKYFVAWNNAVSAEWDKKVNFAVDPGVDEEDENVISKRCKECGNWYDVEEGYPPEEANFCSLTCYDDYQLRKHNITSGEPEELGPESVMKFLGVPLSDRNYKPWYKRFKEWLFSWVG